MPHKLGTVLDSVNDPGVGALGVGVTEVGKDGNGELGLVTSLESGGDLENIRRGSAVAAGNLVVVGGSRCEVLEADLVEELGALSGVGKRTRRGTVVTAMSDMFRPSAL